MSAESRPSNNKIVLIGAGGHAKVVADIIARLGSWELAGCTLPPGAEPSVRGLERLGTDEDLPRLLEQGLALAALGVGAGADTASRRRLGAAVRALGFSLPDLVHPAACVAASVELGGGCQVMAGALINPDARLGADCVVNTGAVVEHDCVLGEHAFIGPRAALGGAAEIGAGALIGIGAAVLPGVRIGEGAVLGAGAVAVRDLPAGRVARGVPARCDGD